MRNLYRTSVWPCYLMWMCWLAFPLMEPFQNHTPPLVFVHSFCFVTAVTHKDIRNLYRTSVRRRKIDLQLIIPCFTALLRFYWFFFFFLNHTPPLVFVTSFCDITGRSMLRLAEGVHTPIALHCSGFIFNVGKSGRNRQILTEHSVKVSPFLFPSTIRESNLIYSECVNLFCFVFFIRICRVF